MTKKPFSTRGNPLRLRLIGEVAVKAGKESNDPRIVAEKRALRLAEKANRQPKAGTFTDGKGNFVMTEK